MSLFRKKKSEELAVVEEKNPELSLYDYERKYVKRQNLRTARLAVFVLAGVIGIVIATCLLLMVLKLWDLHYIAGIVAIVVAVLLFIFVYIVPLIMIMRSDYFVTAVNKTNVRSAQAHNRDLRKKLALKMIDFSQSVDGVGFCNDELVTALEKSVSLNDNEAIKKNLTALYQGPVKKDAKRIIAKKSVKCGLYTALSQDDKADAFIVAMMNFQLVRDIIYLYGFRPSDAKLAKIFVGVLENVLISYSFSASQIGTKILSSIDKVPLANIFGMLLDSGLQGFSSSILTSKLGFQTIHYLNKEYRLQDILDGVSVEASREEIDDAEVELKKEYEAEKKENNIK